MAIQIGEYLVGAYLKLVLECDVVDYNVRVPGGGYRGLEELDLIGLDFKTSTAYLCEVATHIDGLVYGRSNQDTVDKLFQKHERQLAYAREFLQYFEHHEFSFWSPRVPVGFITGELGKLAKLELVINQEYTKRIGELQAIASEQKQDIGNPAFRVLQIVGNLRK